MPKDQGAIDLSSEFEGLHARGVADPKNFSLDDRYELHRLRICLAMPNSEHWYVMLERAGRLSSL
jgi:hypothetical protein